MKNIASAALITLTMAFGTACSTSGEVHAGTSDAIAMAKEANAKAVAAGHGWTTTDKLIKKAETLATEGKADEAAKLAGKAAKLAQAGLDQAQAQKDAGPRF